MTWWPAIDLEAEQFGSDLRMNSAWSPADFDSAKRKIRDINLDKEKCPEQLQQLDEFLRQKRDHLLRLLENPNLLEHETFSQLLRAVFHLTEELNGRLELCDLPKSDYAHLRGDISRVYVVLINQWLDYMKYLKSSYPFLFSLAMRTNPFNPEISIIVAEETAH